MLLTAHSIRFVTDVSENLRDYASNLICKQWRDRIANLVILLRPIANEEVVVRKGLEARGLSNS